MSWSCAKGQPCPTSSAQARARPAFCHLHAVQEIEGRAKPRTQDFRSKFCLTALEKNQTYETKSKMESLGSRLGRVQERSYRLSVEADLVLCLPKTMTNLTRTSSLLETMKYCSGTLPWRLGSPPLWARELYACMEKMENCLKTLGPHTVRPSKNFFVYL